MLQVFNQTYSKNITVLWNKSHTDPKLCMVVYIIIFYLKKCYINISFYLSLPKDDFESKYSFHPLDDFPPPEEYRHFTKIYPSKANRGKSQEMNS